MSILGSNGSWLDFGGDKGFGRDLEAEAVQAQPNGITRNRSVFHKVATAMVDL